MKKTSTPSIYCLVIVLLGSWSVAQAQSPSVVNSLLSPARNAVAAPRTAPVVVPFSQAINPTTAGNVKVFSSQYRGRRTATASVSGSAVTLTPTAPAGQSAGFRPGETLMVSVPATVQGATTGAAVKQVYQFTAGVNGTGRGNFQLGANLYVGFATLSSEALGDVDGDGDLDLLLSTNTNAGVIEVHLNDGSGIFSASSQNVPVGAGSRSAVAGDVDGDGDLDLLTANFTDNTVSVRFNNGSGIFSGNQEVTLTNQPFSLALGDVDGDGDLDIIATAYDYMGTSTACVRLNNGSGTFGGNQDVPVGRYARSITLGDVDNDGDLDLLTASYTLGTVGILLNDGNGLFSGTQSIAVGSQPVGVTMADVDSDGDLDVLATNSGSAPSTVSVRLNNGNGTFSGTQNVVVGIRPTGAAVGDIDGDGDLDLLTINQNNGSYTVSVRSNDGNGTFSGVQDIPVNANVALVVGDVDGDGDLDCVTTGSFISVLLNQMALATSASSDAIDCALYPNPVSAMGRLQLSIRVSIGTHKAQATILNALGQTVATASLLVQAGQAVGSLPTAGLAPGIYTVRLRAGNTVIAKRLQVL